MSTNPSTGADGPGSPPLLPEDTPAAPAELAVACGQCRRCGLAESRQQVVVGRGNPAARLLLIGEAPGAEEDASGQPFVGRAGRLLEQLLAEAGLDSERDLYIANVIKCRPPGNRKPSRAEIAACRPWLEQQIARQRPALIGLLGATALEALLGHKGGITKLRGQWLQPVEDRPQLSSDLLNTAQAIEQQPTESSTSRSPTQKPAQFITQSKTRTTTQRQDQALPTHRPGDHPNKRSINQQNNRSIHRHNINLQAIALMPLLHPSYLLRNPSGLEGSPKWHTLQDLRLLRSRLDDLAAGQD